MATGSVNKDKKNGKWYYILELGKDESGKRIQKKKRGFKTKKEAQQALIELQNSINKGLYIEPSKTLYKDYLSDWFNSKKNSIGIQTAKVYENYMNNRIKKELGNYKLSELKPIHIQNYMNKLYEEGLARSTVKKIFEIVKSSLDHACNLELIQRNPSTKIVIPQKEKSKLLIWDENEVNQFLKVAQEDRYYLAFYLAIMTGMRQGEILGLRWKDIELNEGFLTVNQTLSHDGKTFLSGAKTKSSVRRIQVSPSTVTILKKCRFNIKNEKLKAGSMYQDSDLVICTAIGTPLNPANLRRTFNRIIKEAKLPNIRFHDLRHTHATLLLKKGVNVKVISERLGHSNIKITLETYSHVLPTMQEDAINKLESIINV